MNALLTVSGDSTSSTDTAGTSHYRHLIRLSEGGMGQVDLCVREDGRFKRLYAIKRLQPSIREDEAFRAMFLEEARLAGLVHHPNIVGVLDVGEDEDGPYLVMEYIDGITARDLIGHSQSTFIPIPIEVCLDVVTQAAHGLAQAHVQKDHHGEALRLVHRDVTPHNILVDFTGTARVTDFGVARATGNQHKTRSGVLKGKLGYMAPEVLRFVPHDSKADLFSLGVVFYELLAGRRLYAGDDEERANRIVNEAPPDIGDVRTDVPSGVQTLLLSMLSKDPDLRPTSEAVAAQLDSHLARLRLDPDHCSLRDFVCEGFEDSRVQRRAEIQQALAAPQEVALPSERAPASVWRWLAPMVVTAALAVGAWSFFPRPSEVRPDDQVLVPQAPQDERPAEPSPPNEVQAAPVAASTMMAVAPDARITVTIQTDPSGARVLGPDLNETTPTTFTLPRGDAAVEVSIERIGYRTETRTLTPSEDIELAIDLRRRRRRPTQMNPTVRGLNDIWD